MRRDIMGIDSFAELGTGHWLVHVRIVCVSLYQLILGSMNKQSWNWISLVISQLKNVKNFDILVTKWLSTPRLNIAETSSKFSSSIENLIESQIFHILNEAEYILCEELCRSRVSMLSIGYCLYRPPNIVTMCRLWGFSGGQTIRNGDVLNK